VPQPFSYTVASHEADSPLCTSTAWPTRTRTQPLHNTSAATCSSHVADVPASSSPASTPARCSMHLQLIVSCSRAQMSPIVTQHRGPLIIINTPRRTVYQLNSRTTCNAIPFTALTTSYPPSQTNKLSSVELAPSPSLTSTSKSRVSLRSHYRIR
jgi:hypothetical protein